MKGGVILIIVGIIAVTGITVGAVVLLPDGQDRVVPTPEPELRPEIGLEIVPEPRIIGSVDIPDYARGVFISGNHAFVAAGGRGGLQIIDITNLR